MKTASIDNESVLTVSKIVEQKEVFEKRFKFRKDQLESSYEESTFKSEEVREVVRYSPAAAHQLLKDIAEKSGMNPETTKFVTVNGGSVEMKKVTSRTLLQVQLQVSDCAKHYLENKVQS